MTRWARANNHHKQKPSDATPWDQLKAKEAGGGKSRSGGSASSGGADKGGEKDHLRRTIPTVRGSAVKKPNRKKKEYADEDVNGFLEYLQQTGQQLPNGGDGEDQELREEVKTALKKDSRRETRRVKRQNDKKNKMVGTFTKTLVQSVRS